MSSQDQQTFNDWKGGFKQSEPQARAADQQGQLAEHAHDMAGSAVDATVNDRGRHHHAYEDASQCSTYRPTVFKGLKASDRHFSFTANASSPSKTMTR